MTASTLTMANAMLGSDDDFRMMNSTSSFSSLSAPRRKKSVDFTLLQPQDDTNAATAPSMQQHKRMRLQGQSRWTTKQIVDAMATCVTRSERMEAIQKAIETFSSHDDESHHNQEMAAGADAALLKHFVFVSQMSQLEKKDEPVGQHPQDYSTDTPIITTEMALTMQAMELVYRSSSSMVRASFLRMGSTTLTLLLSIMEREIDRRLTAGPMESATDEYGNELDDGNLQVEFDASQDATLFLQYATKLLGHFARVADAVKTLANFPKCLHVLIRFCQPPYSAIPWQARLSALWVLANLACDSENMEMMVAQEGLIKTLVKVACRPLYRSDSAMHNLEHIMELLRSRNIASRAILNLSWAPGNKGILADNVVLLDLVAELCVHRQAPLPSSHTVSGILVSTRRHAVGALRNLAAAPKLVKLHLCAYRQGHLLDVLTDAALNDPDTHVKERAFAAIHNIAIQDTAEQIVNHPALVLALRDVLLSSSSSSDEESAMKQHASSTILVLERTITPDMAAYENLRDLLQAINPASVESESEDEQVSGRSSAILHPTAAV